MSEMAYFLFSLNSQSATVSESTFPGTEELVMKQKRSIILKSNFFICQTGHL